MALCSWQWCSLNSLRLEFKKVVVCAAVSNRGNKKNDEEDKVAIRMDQISFSARQFSAVTSPKIGMLAPGDGISVWVLGVLVTIKALGNETGGSYSLFEEVIYPGQGLPRHVHTLEDETWYMLEGELMWDLGGREFHGKKGSFIHLPRFVPHSFKNKSKKPARMVLMFAPGGVEQWYLDVGEKASDLKAMPPRVTHEVFSQALCRGKEYGIMFIDHREDEEFSNGSVQAGYF